MAIAFLTGTGGHGNVSSFTTALDCTGATVLIVGVWGVGNLNTGVTYHGTGMTQIGSAFQYNTGEFLYMYYLASPTTGSNNIVVSFSGSANCSFSAECFSGTATTGIPDASNTNSGASGAGSVAVTTVADNSMGVALARFENGSPSTSAGMSLGFDSTFSAIYYTTALKTPAGSLTMNATSTNPIANWGMIGISLAPPAPPGNKTNFLAFM